MDVTDELFDEAKAGRKAAVVRVLASQVPEAFAIIALLTGEYAAARAGIDTLVRSAMRALPGFADSAAPQRWFRHHAVLTAREYARTTTDDPAIFTPAESARPAELPAFIKAIRALDPQQQEAFLLHYGLLLGPRAIGIAMDCSTTAAGNHLAAAERAIKPLVGGSYDSLINLLRDCASQLMIVENAEGFVEKRYALRRRRRTHEKLLTLLVAMVVIAAIAWFVWPHRGAIQQKVHDTIDTIENFAYPPATQPTTAD